MVGGEGGGRGGLTRLSGNTNIQCPLAFASTRLAVAGQRHLLSCVISSGSRQRAPLRIGAWQTGMNDPSVLEILESKS